MYICIYYANTHTHTHTQATYNAAGREPLVAGVEDAIEHGLIQQRIPHPLRYDHVHLYVCVCVCMCVYVCGYVCPIHSDMITSTYMCVYACVCVYAYLYVNVCISRCMHNQ